MRLAVAEASRRIAALARCARSCQAWQIERLVARSSAPTLPCADGEVTVLMDMTDALGRRRRLTQNRGLRPLFPKLPSEYRSRLIRLAMSLPAWERLERLVARSTAPTQPRAYGAVVERLLENFDSSSRVPVSPSSQMLPNAMVEPVHESRQAWQAWQMQKELALLAASAP